MNLGLMVFLLLLLLSFMGLPIGFALGVGTMAAVLYGDLPPLIIPQRIFTGCDSIPLLAIPFFLLAGNMMSYGITKKILDFSNAMLGAVRGGLAAVSVVAAAIFAAISGSSVATVSAIGSMTIPAMKEEGYGTEYSAAVAATASILGVIIPPSIFLIVYGSATETSIGQLFIGAVIPGILLTLVLVAYVLLWARKRNFPARGRIDFKTMTRVTADSSWALFMPVLILGGIFGGIFTATEAAAVSVGYAFVVCMFVYKGLKWGDLPQVIVKSAISTSAIMMLLAFSKVSSWVVVTSGFPQAVVGLARAVTESPVIILLLLNMLLLVMGMLMEGNACIIMLAPLLVPLMKMYGISSMHFGVVMGLNLAIGLVTPPVGACLLLGNEIAGAKLATTMKCVLPMIILSLIVLMITTYMPATTQWLPSLMK